MIAYRARHACGTEVTDELPDGYPVHEGVGLWCPVCCESFWHTGDEPEPVQFLPPRAPEPAPDAEAPPKPDAPVRRRRWLRSS